jgi:hypothetical protein
LDATSTSFRKKATTLGISQYPSDIRYSLPAQVCKKYPPDVAYTARVLKLVILAAEKDAFTGTTADSDKEEEPVLEEVYVEHMKYMEAVSKLVSDLESLGLDKQGTAHKQCFKRRASDALLMRWHPG